MQTPNSRSLITKTPPNITPNLWKQPNLYLHLHLFLLKQLRTLLLLPRDFFLSICQLLLHKQSSCPGTVGSCGLQGSVLFHPEISAELRSHGMAAAAMRILMHGSGLYLLCGSGQHFGWWEYCPGLTSAVAISQHPLCAGGRGLRSRNIMRCHGC